MSLHVAPTGWTASKLAAWNELLAAVDQYETYSAALTRLGITSGPYVTAQNNLANLITQTLGPAFLAAS